jgi:hypothetical protein
MFNCSVLLKDDLIKSVLETERKNVQDELSVLKEEFEKK